MQATGVDVLITAPQKGWTGTPCCAMVMLSENARQRIEETTSTSFSIDLRKWLQIMETYEGGGHAYHATMPTDGLRRLREVMEETENDGLEDVRDAQQRLGERVRALLERHGYASVAAEGFQSPSVVVSYADDGGIVGRFAGVGLQVAGAVPLMCDEPEDYQAFRIGLFGLDKLENVDRTIDRLEQALERLERG
jgi:aspartate aminotransferase-like enzyme